MKSFLDQQFMLNSNTAQMLYHEYAAKMPIIDYHSHLSPADIVNDRIFNNITEAWLEGDHYKWRAMRANGIDERCCTGEASDSEKFHKWAETVPYTMRNPLYHWTHLELQRYFEIRDPLNPDTAEAIYAKTGEKLQSMSTQALLAMMNVEVVCTTDDPIDSLSAHQEWKQSGKTMLLIPAFRPDKVLFTEEDSWNAYIDQLSDVSNIEIDNYENLIGALKVRHDYFHANKCRLSDNGLGHMYADNFSLKGVQRIFDELRAGKKVKKKSADKFRSAVLLELGRMNHARGWTQQYHLGALRNNNTRMLGRLGKDTGFDSMGDFNQAQSLSRFLDRLDSTDQLAKTIVYNLNPADNAVMATMMGNFNDGSVPGKMQFGSGWWYLDQKDGIEQQLNTLSNMGLLSRFVGMLTDSRSFLSFPRHEYFRRVLCNLIGSDVEKGELPNDTQWLGKIVQDISYNNALSYFNFQS